MSYLVACWFVEGARDICELEDLLEVHRDVNAIFSHFCKCNQQIWDDDYKCHCVHPLKNAVICLLDNAPELLKKIIPKSNYNLIHGLASSVLWEFTDYQRGLLRIWLRSETVKT